MSICRPVQREEPERLGDLAQLAGMCRVFASDAFTPFSFEELTADTGRRLRQYAELLDDLVSRAFRLTGVSGDGKSWGKDLRWYGRYLSLPGGWEGYLHFSAYKWSHNAATPFWLWVKDAAQSHNPVVVEHVLAPLWGTRWQPVPGEQWQVPLHPPTGVDRDEVLASLERQLDRVLDLIRDHTATQESP